MDWLSLFNITEVKNSDFQILAAGDDVVSSRRNSQGVDGRPSEAGKRQGQP